MSTLIRIARCFLLHRHYHEPYYAHRRFSFICNRCRYLFEGLPYLG